MHRQGTKNNACTPLTTQTARVLSVYWMQERPSDNRATRCSPPAAAEASAGTPWRCSHGQVRPHRRTGMARALRATRLSRRHTLRHSCAMNLLRSGVEPAVIALWLGHQNLRSVESYIHADMALKERALARTAPLATTPGRYRPPDRLIDFLEAL